MDSLVALCKDRTQSAMDDDVAIDVCAGREPPTAGEAQKIEGNVGSNGKFNDDE